MKPFRVAIASALACTLLLSACTNSPEEKSQRPNQQPTSTPSTSAPINGSLTQIAGPRVFTDPATSTSKVEAQNFISYTASQRKYINNNRFNLYKSGGVVFTESLAIIAPSTQVLTAVDKSTGKVVWQRQLPQHQGETQLLCSMNRPSSDAKVVAVFMDLSCARMYLFDIATGKQVGQKVFGDKKYPDTKGIQQVGEYTFIAYDYTTQAGLWRLGPQGGVSPVIDMSDLGLQSSEYISALMRIPGTAMLVLDVENTAKDGPLSGRFIGLQVQATGSVKVRWKIGKSTAVGKAPLVPNDFGTTIFPFEGLQEGTAFYSVLKKGVNTPRLSLQNPNTGKLDKTFVLPQNPPGRFPAWASGVGFRDHGYVFFDGTQLFGVAGIAGSTGFANLVRYDMGKNKIAWVWKPAARPGAINTKVVGVTSGRTFVYATVRGDNRTQLVKVNYQTGKLAKVWELPSQFDQNLRAADVYVEDDMLVWVNNNYFPNDNIYAGVLRVK